MLVPPERSQATSWTAVVAMVLLAGCASSDGATSSSSTTSSSTSHAVVAASAPTLRVGDWWTLESPGGTFSVVVAADAGSDWTFRTDNPGTAYFDQVSDISYLGPQRKADLAGSQGNDRVQFFSFPLQDNKTWTTTWDHAPVTITAHNGSKPGTFSMVARNATGVYARYTYDAAAGWFSDLTFLAPDGSDGYAIKLQARGHNYTGTLASWDLVTVADVHGDLATMSSTAQTYDVPATATDVYADIELVCTSGAAGAGTGPAPFVAAAAGQDDRGAGTPGTACPATNLYHGAAGAVHPDATGKETWGWDVVGGAGTVGHLDLTIRVRTLHQAALGAA